MEDALLQITIVKQPHNEVDQCVKLFQKEKENPILVFLGVNVAVISMAVMLPV